MRRRILRIAIRSGVSLSAIVLTLLVVDRTIGLVGGDVIKPVNELAMEVGTNAVGTRLRPGADLRYTNAEFSIRISINEIGLRGPLPALPKPPGTTRILALGDSFTFGQGVETDQAWPHLVAGHLSGGRDVDVINAGWAAPSPVGQAEWLRTYGMRLEPDVVIQAIFVGNDVVDDLAERRGVTRAVDQVEHGARFMTNLGARTGIVGLARDVVDRALPNLYELATLAIVKMQYVTAGRRGHFDYILEVNGPEEIREGWTYTLEAIDSVNAITTGVGARAAFVIIPFYDQLAPARDDRHDPTLPQSIILRHCAERGLTCLDLLPAFQGHRGAAPLYYLKDGHWTADGQELAAARISQWIRDERLVR